jgi:hypothetical protein
MKSWGLVWLVALLSSIPILLSRSTSPGLLQDSDTGFLLKIIRQRGDPAYWFTHDWPLMNHFYRPISTMTFEMDNALYGDHAWGYGLTNALLCCTAVFLLAWLVRELTDSIPIAAFCTALFGIWHWEATGWMAPWVGYFAAAIGFLGLFRHGFKVGLWLPAVAALAFFARELSGIAPLYFRMVGWLPGRTASVMTVFCLIAMAGYARYERLSAERLEPNPTSLDEPAGTRGTVLSGGRTRFAGIWLFISILCVFFALGSYEQAVMLPAALLGVAVSLRLQRYQVRWGWQAAFWGALVLYFLARRAFLPEGASAYQDQQFAGGNMGKVLFLSDYLLPSLGAVLTQVRVLDMGWSLMVTPHLYIAIWRAVANVYGYVAAARHWALALTGFSLSAIAYLPMAWLHQFDHYHYWPMALRTLFVAVLGWGAWELCVIAVSPRARQAPTRPSPAPGSLPRP